MTQGKQEIAPMRLTALEKQLIKVFAGQDQDWSLLANLDLDKLIVADRKITGVGAYVVFDRESQLPPTPGVSAQLGLAAEIVVPGLSNGLGAVLYVEDGQLDCIELFTYDEEWNGDTTAGRIVPFHI